MYLAVDELEIPRALRIAVASPVLGTGLVVGELGHTTVGVHLGEVQRAVDTAREARNIDVEGELLVEELEDLVVGVVGHEEDTRTDSIHRVLSDESEGEGIAAGRDAVGAGVVGAVKRAVTGACHAVGAGRSVERVAGMAATVSDGHEQPAPVRIEGDAARSLGGAAAALGAFLPREFGVDFWRLGARLLSEPKGKER